MADGWSVMGLSVEAEEVCLTVVCHGTVAHIKVAADDLRTTEKQGSALSRELQHMLDRYELSGSTEELENWMSRPCSEYLEETFHSKPVTRAGDRSLQDVFHEKPCFLQLLLRLKYHKGSLQARRIPENPAESTYLSLRIPSSDDTVIFARQQGIPCISASEVRTTREEDASNLCQRGKPQLVQYGNSHFSAIFKAAATKSSFTRELRTLVHIRNADPERTLRTSRLIGLVQWDGVGSIAGLLIEHIPDTRALRVAADEVGLDVRKGWARQLRKTLSSLHDARIVWGDAAAHNVLIDSADQPWIIDFDFASTGGEEDDQKEMDRISDFLESGLGWAEWIRQRNIAPKPCAV